MTQNELLAVLKELVVDTANQGSPALAADLAALRTKVDGAVTVDSPLGSLGWDSMHMTWILVRVEERFDIDTSSLSLFDLFTVGDLLRELLALIHARAPEAAGRG
jgi:acyl carrier protein